MEENKVISFNTEEEVRAAANNLINESAKAQDEQTSLFEDLANEIENLDPSLGGFEELSVLLSLPDEQFQLVAPIFLDELSRAYTNVNDTMVLVQTFNANGIKLEDIMSEFTSIVDAIDAMPEESGITQVKKDFLKQYMGISMNAISSAHGIEKRILEVPVKITNGCKSPVYAHITDAGADVFAAEDMDIMPGEHKVINTGVALLVPKGYEVQVRMKSGIAVKTNLVLKNGVGTIDEFYNGEIGVILANIDPPIKDIEIDEDGRVKSILRGSVEHIEKGQKIAQILLAESPKMHFYEVDELTVPEGARGAGGYGSTGK